MKPLPNNAKIAVIGGDERQIYCGVYLADKGYEVALFGFDMFSGDVGLCTKCKTLEDAVCGCNIIILPMPVSHEGKYLSAPYMAEHIDLSQIFQSVGMDKFVLCGRADDFTVELSEKCGVKLYDYFDKEELQIANAYLTAESAVGIALKERKVSLRDSPILVMGYGRIGKALCHILKGMGADVYASARKRRDFEWIRAFGYSPVDTSKVCDIVSECKLIFNTIPGLVLGEDKLYCIPKDCLIIDLASKPGGVDFEAAKKCGLNVIWALALPGKRLPVSAGKAVADTILNILEDEGVIE